MRSITMRTDQLRDAIQKTARMLAKDDVRITQIGAQPFCEFNDKTGKVKRINLPVIPDNPPEEFLTALQGFLDHEVAHKYLTVMQDYGGKHIIQDPDGSSRKVDVSVMTNIVEDVRIEREFTKMFAGAEANLESMRDFMIERYWGKWLGQVEASALPADEKEKRLRTLALVPFMRARGGQKKCAQWLTDNNLWVLYEPLDVRIPDLAKRFADLTSTKDATDLAKAIIEAMYPPEPKQEPQPDQEPDEGEGALGHAEGGTAQSPEEEEGETGNEAGSGPGEGPEGDDLDDVDFGADGEMDDGPPEDDQRGPSEGSDDDNGDADGESDDEGEGASGEEDDGESAGGKNTSVTLREAMNKLSPEQRRALFLYNKRKESIPDIARKLGKTVASTEALIGKARRKLSQELSK